MPKSIVTKPVPPMGCISGVPAKLQSHQRFFLSAMATEVIDREVKTDWVTRCLIHNDTHVFNILVELGRVY
jgi:hypothetical protein